MCADRALLSIGGIVNHLHNCDKIIYRPDSHNLLCRDFARDATPLVIIADEAPQVCPIICANWNFEREYFVPLGRLVFLVFRFTLGKVLLLLPENAVSYPSNARRCRNTTTATAFHDDTKVPLFVGGTPPHG